MTFDRADFSKYAESERSRRNEANRPQLEYLAQSEVSMENLMGTPEWNQYQQILQGAADRAKKAQASIEQQLLSLSVVNAEEIIRLKLAWAQGRGMIDALESAIALPAQIRDEGEKANLTLQSLSDLEGVNGSPKAEKSAA